MTPEKPETRPGIGMDGLPASVRNSMILNGRELGQLANVHEIPEVDPSFHDERLTNIFLYFSVNPSEMEKELHHYARELLRQGKTGEAWQVLLALN